MAILTPRLLKRGLQIFAVISVLGVAAILFVTGAWTATLDAFTRVRPVWMLAALLLASSDWLGGGLRIWLLTRHVWKQTPYWGMAVAGGLTAWAAYLTPAQTGGGPTMILTMKRFGVPVPEAMTATLMSFITTIVFFAIAGPLCVIFGAGRSLATHGVLGLGFSLYDVFKTTAAIFAFVGFVLVMMVTFPQHAARLLHRIAGWLVAHRGTKWAPRLEAMREGLDRMSTCVRSYFSTPAGWLQMFVGILTSGLAHANRLLAGYVAMRALGIEAHFVDILVLQVTVSFLLYFAPTPGGAGAAEALSAAIMSTYVPEALLPAYTIIWRFTTSYATVIFGSFVFYKLLNGKLEEADNDGRKAERGGTVLSG